jgi:hypothetical protein
MHKITEFYVCPNITSKICTTATFKSFGEQKIPIQIELLRMSWYFLHQTSCVSVQRFMSCLHKTKFELHANFQQSFTLVLLVFHKKKVLLKAFRMAYPYADWWKFCTQVRSLNVHVRMVEDTGLKRMTSVPPLMTWSPHKFHKNLLICYKGTSIRTDTTMIHNPLFPFGESRLKGEEQEMEKTAER